MIKKIKTAISFLIPTVFFTASLTALAAPQSFSELVNGLIINGLIKPVVPLLVGLAVVVFVYGVFKYIFANGGEDKEEGKSYMVWGIVGLFVMVSVWGFVSILVETFNLDPTPRTIEIKPPQI